MTATLIRFGTVTLAAAFGVVLAGPASAGMKADLKNCTNAASETGADACTRVLNSGRLIGKQRYIGHYNRAWAYRNAGQFDAALSDLKISADLNPAHADTYYSMAVVHLDQNDKNRASEALDQYLDHQKDKHLAHYMRALMYRRMNNPDQALADLDKAAVIKPAGPQELIVRALAISDKGQHREAQAMLDGVIGGAPKKADAYYARAMVRQRGQNLPAAARDADQALELQKDFPAAELLAGRIAEERGDVSGARLRYDRVAGMAAKSIDAMAAKNDASARLNRLNGPMTGAIASAENASGSTSQENCHRFVRELGRVMAVDCAQK